MFKEIGGNFWLEPEELNARAGGDLLLPGIDSYKDATYVSSGRGAISLILEQLNQPGGSVLLPSYICESVIMPFKKFGYNTYFYDINKDLSINKESLCACVKKYRPKIAYTTSYFGFDTLYFIKSEYQWLKEQGIIIIEDITHSLFSHFKKGDADYYLASLRKWMGLPDGGIAMSLNHKIKSKQKYAIHEELVQQNIKASIMKYEYTKNLDAPSKDKFRQLFYSSEDWLDKDCGIYGMSPISKRIFNKTDTEKISIDRRINYKYLKDSLKESCFISPVFNELPREVVPLYLPVYVKRDRNRIQTYLAENEIYAPIHWPIPKDCENLLSKTSSYIYNKILSIPCDQRYSPAYLSRIPTKMSDYSC